MWVDSLQFPGIDSILYIENKLWRISLMNWMSGCKLVLSCSLLYVLELLLYKLSILSSKHGSWVKPISILYSSIIFCISYIIFISVNNKESSINFIFILLLSMEIIITYWLSSSSIFLICFIIKSITIAEPADERFFSQKKLISLKFLVISKILIKT